MPRGDRTGPNGMGQMTGRGLGFCAGYPVPGYGNQGYGFGYGRGMGRGFNRGGGFGRGYRQRNFWNAPPNYVEPGFNYNYQPPQPTPEDEKKFLESQIDMLAQNIEDLKKRLDELKKEKK